MAFSDSINGFFDSVNNTLRDLGKGIADSIGALNQTRLDVKTSYSAIGGQPTPPPAQGSQPQVGASGVSPVLIGIGVVTVIVIAKKIIK